MIDDMSKHGPGITEIFTIDGWTLVYNNDLFFGCFQMVNGSIHISIWDQIGSLHNEIIPRKFIKAVKSYIRLTQ